MAGDEIKIAESGFLMIHNAWYVCIGNKNDMRESADTLDKFDESMQGVYTKQTGINQETIAQMMDAETWLSGKDALEQGFATDYLDSDETTVEDDEDNAYNSSLRKVDVALAQSGKTRSERRRIIKDLSGTPCATDEKDQSPCADQPKLNGAIASLSQTLKKRGH